MFLMYFSILKKYNVPDKVKLCIIKKKSNVPNVY